MSELDRDQLIMKTTHLTVAQIKKLDEYARTQSVSRAMVIRRAVDAYLGSDDDTEIEQSKMALA